MAGKGWQGLSDRHKKTRHGGRVDLLDMGLRLVQLKQPRQHGGQWPMASFNPLKVTGADSQQGCSLLLR